MMNLNMSPKKIVQLVTILIIVAAAFNFFRPLPPINPTITLAAPSFSVTGDLVLPNYGQSALLAQDYGLLTTAGQQQSVPMASIAKLVTALAVLQQKPLQKGQAGPNILLTKDDVVIYNAYLAKEGSVLKIIEGENLTEYEALQAILIPSANNIADTLALWAFGSIENYITYANKMVGDLGLTQTKIADASGFSDTSLSSAVDLVKLGQVAMDNEIIREIVAQPSTILPLAGTVYNYNFLLGNDGVIGIKTGNTDQAGGCYLFATNKLINGQSVTIIGAVMGAPNLVTVLKDSKALIQSFDSGLGSITIVKKGQAIGYYQTPWGTKSDIVAKDDLLILGWKNTTVKLDTQVTTLKTPVVSGQETGKIVATLGGQSKTVAVELKNNLAGPSWTWRLFH